MIDWLSNIQALLVTLGAFGLVLVLARVKVPLAIALLVGTAGVGAAFKLGPGQIARAAVSGVSEPRTIGLIILTGVLLLLSGIMRQAGQMDRIVSLAKDMLRRPAAAMVALPALIGLIPMPGGALFSAPMVESAAGDESVPGSRLSAINYWYRHIWEHWWPLYPGVLLAVSMADEKLTVADQGLGLFMAFQFPMGVFAAAAGLTGEKDGPSGTSGQESESNTTGQEAAPLDALCPAATVVLLTLIRHHHPGGRGQPFILRHPKQRTCTLSFVLDSIVKWNMAPIG